MRVHDLKQTPQKISTHSTKKKIHEESFTKELHCPFLQIFTPTVFTSLTPIRKQPQYLLSPSPVRKDLFSQLLGTQTKYLSPIDQDNEIIEEEDICMSEFSSEYSSSMDQEECSQNQANWSQQNAIRKRKRKSTAQIKLLKQELDGQMNWTKQKIMKMAQITGLSQSQVYKWCWDQKKKQGKGNLQSKSNLDKRRFIKKNLNYRQQFEMKLEEINENDEKQNVKETMNRRTMTKIKAGSTIVDGNETQKKVNKRLVFF